MDNGYFHLLNKSRDAKRGGRDAWGALSTGDELSSRWRSTGRIDRRLLL